MGKTLTEKQLAANRANAQKSTGPKTPGGKYNSSRNRASIRQLAQCLVLPEESRPNFCELTKDLYNFFQPANAYENELVEVMAAARWRMQRQWYMEKATLIHELRKQPSSYPAQGSATSDPVFGYARAQRALSEPPRALDAISRLEGRYDRTYHRAADRLLKIQERRLNLEIEIEKMRHRTHDVIESKEKCFGTEPIQTAIEALSNPDRTGSEPAPTLQPIPIDSYPNRRYPQPEDCDILNQDKKSPLSC